MNPFRLFPQTIFLTGLLASSLSAPAWPAPITSPPMPLLPQATRLFPMDASFNKGGVEQPWLSPHELLHFKHGELCRYDMTTHTDTPLPALTRQVVGSPAYLDFVEASPDGQWVLWGESANNPIFAAPLDGKQRLSWPGHGGMGQPYWCADGHRWLQVLLGMKGFSLTSPKVNYTQALLQDVDAPQDTETLAALPPGLSGLDVLAVVSDREIVARTPDTTTFGPSKSTPPPSGSPSGVFSFTIEERPTFRAVQQISVWDLRQATPLHQWTVRLPGQVQEVAVSSLGDRAAWLISGPTPKTGRADHLRTSLWVSGLDGDGLREVGYVDTTVDMAAMKHLSMAQMESYPPPLPLMPQWSPDGKQVSFLCRGALWAVPVP